MTCRDTGFKVGLAIAAMLMATRVSLASQGGSELQPTGVSIAQTREQEDRGERRGQDRPDRPEGERGGQDGPGGRGGPGQGPPRGMWSEPTPEQWESTVAFLRENSPRRLELYERAVQEWRAGPQAATQPEGELPRSIRGGRARIYGRVRLLQMIEDRDPPLYSLELRLFRLEDDIIGGLFDARQARQAGNAAGAEEAARNAQEAVRNYALGMLEQREARIQRMREELSREEERLQQDRSEMDKLMERLMERFMRSVPGEGPPPGTEGARQDEGRRPPGT